MATRSINTVDEDEDYNDEPVAPTRKKGQTIADALREELLKPPTTKKTAVVAVPGKPGMTLKINTSLPLHVFNRMQRRATDKKSQIIDLAEFNAGILVAQTICLQLNGEDAEDAEGTPLDFKHAEVHDMLNAMDDRGAVRALIPRDSDLLSIGSKVLDACGYGDREEDDPLDSEND